MDLESGAYHRNLEKATGDPDELRSLIREGEHQEQDFKFRIDSNLKIARTLSAFANTDGGRLLIGVKDNGRIAGIDPEEEYFMIEGAAELYCEPKVKFSFEVFELDDRLVLLIDVPPSDERPHRVKERDGSKLAYIRQADENFVANKVLVQFMLDKDPDVQRKNLVAYGPAERSLFDYLSQNEDISVSKFTRIAQIKNYKAVKILALFLKWEVIEYKANDKGIRFRLKEDAKA
ncbi:MAG: ATP-binding protein [Bacteroidetes bacterium]|nr:ATP-binding protein [Bacteroidota bacterium]